MSDLPDLLPERDSGYPTWKRTALFTLGCVCMVLGVIGWLVPVVTGVPFYIAGLVLLGLASVRAARAINLLERRLPHRARLLLRRAMPRGGNTE
ncbi:MAG: DUF454 domain-containing protein [Planctomycetes bacterium]|nr:DUF454 domain-containing protein [Planctomycetota bacterium]